MITTFQAPFPKWLSNLQLQNDTTVSFKDLAFVNEMVMKFYKHFDRGDGCSICYNFKANKK